METNGKFPILEFEGDKRFDGKSIAQLEKFCVTKVPFKELAQE